MDRETEQGVIGVIGASALVIGMIFGFRALKKRGSIYSSSAGNYITSPDYGDSDAIPFQHRYEVSDDGYYITSWCGDPKIVGWRNHNPLNIVISNNNWVGKISPNTDGKHEQFVANIYGYRAACINMRSYITEGYNTIRKIVNRWSGKSNNTPYINYVSKVSGISADRVITVNDWEDIVTILYAMTCFECGTNPDPDIDEIIDGCLLVRYGH